MYCSISHDLPHLFALDYGNVNQASLGMWPAMGATGAPPPPVGGGIPPVAVVEMWLEKTWERLALDPHWWGAGGRPGDSLLLRERVPNSWDTGSWRPSPILRGPERPARLLGWLLHC